MSSSAMHSKLMPLLAIPAVAVVIIGLVLLAAWSSTKKKPEAPNPPPLVQPQLLPPGERPPLADQLAAVADDLRMAPPEKRPTLRYLTLAHLGERKEGIALMLHRLAPRAAGNPFEPRGVGLQELGGSGDVIAVDLAEWTLSNEEWDRITRANPYALRHEQAANDHVRAAATDLRTLTDLPNPIIRADWFLFRLGSMPVSARPTVWSDGRRFADSEWLENYRRERLTLPHAAVECGGPPPERLLDFLRAQPELIERFRLRPQLAGESITRADWERPVVGISAAQELSRLAGLGVPIPISADGTIE